MKICMLSSVHSANDIRIVEKEARSLSEAGHEVTVVARPPRPNDVGRIAFKLIELPPVARWKRPWVMGRAAIELARTSGSDVVQFHDPELIPFALLLKRQRCKVIYDVHEDVPSDIHSKRWIWPWMRPFVSRGMELAERAASRRFDAIVAATPAIAERFYAYGADVTLVRNTARLDEFIAPTATTRRRRQAVYVGRTSFDRGLVEMVEACSAVRLPLVLAGTLGREEQSWLETSSADVSYRGQLGRSDVARLLNESLIGLNLLLPEPNYLLSLPTKLFEYMAAGLPVITSDLPKSREIVEAAGCGFVVSLNDRKSLLDCMSRLADDPGQAIELGLAGRAAVAENFSWQHDAAELNRLYARFASREADR